MAFIFYSGKFLGTTNRYHFDKNELKGRQKKVWIRKWDFVAFQENLLFWFLPNSGYFVDIVLSKCWLNFRSSAPPLIAPFGPSAKGKSPEKRKRWPVRDVEVPVHEIFEEKKEEMAAAHDCDLLNLKWRFPIFGSVEGKGSSHPTNVHTCPSPDLYKLK